MFKKRIITALFGIPLLAVIIWFDTPLPWFTILVAVWGLREFAQAAQVLYPDSFPRSAGRK